MTTPGLIASRADAMQSNALCARRREQSEAAGEADALRALEDIAKTLPKRRRNKPGKEKRK